MRSSILVGLCFLLARSADAQSPSLAQQPTPIRAFFSPKGGCTSAVVDTLKAAKTSVMIQAYGFTSKDIAFEAVQTKRRGVPVRVILDKSNKTDKYSSADFLVNMGVSVWIDGKHAIAHDKVMIIDSALVVTGSFNFTKAAEKRNSENLLLISDKNLAAQYEKHWSEHLAHSTQYVGKPEAVGASIATSGPTAEPNVMAISQAKLPGEDAVSKKERPPRQAVTIRFGYSADVLMQQIALSGEELIWVGDPYADAENDFKTMFPKEAPWSDGMIAVFTDQAGIGKAAWLANDGLYGRFHKDEGLISTWIGNPQKEREKYMAAQGVAAEEPVTEERKQ